MSVDLGGVYQCCRVFGWSVFEKSIWCDLVTVVGALLGAHPGESLRMRSRWGSHPQYGKQFHVEDYITVLPATVQGIRRYLGSGLGKGIGPKTTERIVEHFGVTALDVIEQEPGRLIEVSGLPPGRRRVHLAGGADLQAVRQPGHRRGAERAVPVGG